MIKVKQVLDDLEKDDGLRVWVEPIGCTRDLQELCRIDRVESRLGPSVHLWRWFEQHPGAYDYFRAQYHELLHNGPHRAALEDLIRASRVGTVTLLHQSDNPVHNTAMALYEFLCELEAYIKPDKS
jgi:uncharacterized protein YeaO (DUF488 family)